LAFLFHEAYPLFSSRTESLLHGASLLHVPSIHYPSTTSIFSERETPPGALRRLSFFGVRCKHYSGPLRPQMHPLSYSRLLCEAVPPLLPLCRLRTLSFFPKGPPPVILTLASRFWVYKVRKCPCLDFPSCFCLCIFDLFQPLNLFFFFFFSFLFFFFF